MKILSDGYKATASLESYQDTRNRLQDALDALMPEYKYDPLITLIDGIANEIDSIDVEIKGLKREEEIAERNHEHDLREDRPNA